MEELALKSEKKEKNVDVANTNILTNKGQIMVFLVTFISSSPAQDQSVHQLLHQAPTFPRTVN